MVERAGRLVNVMDAKTRSARMYCALCSQRGALVGCVVKECKRSFDLRCAVAAHCTLMETRLDQSEGPSAEAGTFVNDSAEQDCRVNNDNDPHEVFTQITCPEHFQKIDRNRITRRWRPSEPLRRLSVDGSYEL